MELRSLSRREYLMAKNEIQNIMFKYQMNVVDQSNTNFNVQRLWNNSQAPTMMSPPQTPQQAIDTPGGVQPQSMPPQASYWSMQPQQNNMNTGRQ